MVLAIWMMGNASAQVAWVDWTATTAGGVDGTVTVDGTTVDVSYTGEVAFAQVSGGTNYWVPSDPYISALVPNAPPDTDIIALSQATDKTLTFSEPITNPLFAVVSLNGNGYRFDRDFEVVSFGNGYWGNGTLTKTITTNPDGTVTYDLIGTGEPHGVIRFLGTFTTVSWSSLTNEYWNGFSVAVDNLAAAVPPEIAVFDGPDTVSPEITDGQAAPVEFGPVFPGTATGDTGVSAWGTVVRELTIENTGTGPLNFGTVVVSGSGASAFTVSALPPALAAGDSLVFTVTFGPGGPGSFDAVLSIPNDDADEDPFDFPLHGGGAAGGTADTGVDTAVVDTGSVDTGGVDTAVVDTSANDTGIADTDTDADTDSDTDADTDADSDADADTDSDTDADTDADADTDTDTDTDADADADTDTDTDVRKGGCGCDGAGGGSLGLLTPLLMVLVRRR